MRSTDKLIKTTILDNEFVTMWYYPQLKVIHHQFHQFIHGEPFRKVLMTGLEYFEKEGCVRWLSDDRANSALPKEDAEWAVINWSPRVEKAGWKYWAMILPDKVIGKMNMRRFIREYGDKGVKIEIFEDAETALTWLTSVG